MADEPQTLAEPAPGFTLGVSVSDSPDLARLGLTENHIRMALGEVAQATLIAKGRLSYGGHLRDDGYTAFLVHECERYGSRDRPLTGHIPWSVHRRLTVDQINAHRKAIGLYGTYVFLDPDGQPIEDPTADRDPGPQDVGDREVADSLTAARHHLTATCEARLVVGGQRADSRGTCPASSRKRSSRSVLASQCSSQAASVAPRGTSPGSSGFDPENWLGLPYEAGRRDLRDLANVMQETGWTPAGTGLPSNRTSNSPSVTGPARSPRWLSTALPTSVPDDDHVDPAALTLDEYQRLSAATDIDADNDDPIIPLLGLAGEIGSLIAEYKKKIRPDGAGYVGFDAVIRIELGDILWYLASLTSRSGLTLGEVAVANLTKTRARWLPGDGAPPTSYDDDMPNGQRLPRRFEALFTTYVENGLTKCSMTIDGEEFGDPIDDNTRYEDNYRFHDVFHLAHAAILGWSPVLRLLVGRKRRNDDRDRTEDGARGGRVIVDLDAATIEYISD